MRVLHGPVVAGFLFLVTALAAGCGRSAPAKGVGTEPAAVPVAVAAVRLSDESIPVEATGLLSRKDETELAFKVGGVVAEVAVRAGDAVQPGQVLAALKRAETAAQVAQARAALEKARRDQERARRLVVEQVMTREQAQNADTQVEQAAAALQAAEFNFEHAVIRAPGEGRILRRLAEPNQTVGGGQPILTFAAESEGWLARVNVAAHELPRLRFGDRAELRLRGWPEPLPARVVQVAAGTDPAVRTGELELRPERVPPQLPAGAVVSVRVYPGAVTARPVIPASALVEGQGRRAFVFALNGDGATVRRLEVVVEALAGSEAYLQTALPAGTRLVTRGAEYLREGAGVRLVGPQVASASDSGPPEAGEVAR